MAYIESNEISAVLDQTPELQKYLYNRGFLISTERLTLSDAYPFYGNWREEIIAPGIYAYLHSNTHFYSYCHSNRTFFLVGHAYDPYHMEIDERRLLVALADAKNIRDNEFWNRESDLTGVFCLGYYENGNVIYTTDCCGMQLVYHGVVGNEFFITSHCKLVADIKGLRQTEYIRRLISNRFWHYWGTWLPGDLSPFAELKRMVPNHFGAYSIETHHYEVTRFYPTRKIEETKTEKEYTETIHELGHIMSNTMQCIAAKWPDKKISISVTGGRDSMTALSCANQVYDKLSYFSYISNEDESVDAYAAQKILSHIDLPHEIIEIPEQWDGYKNLSAFKSVMECNNGCIGENNTNDLKKRLFFTAHPPCDMEVKSWVNEMGRGWYYNKYNKSNFPKYPNASYWRAMHKVYLSPYLIRETDRVFQEYLANYYSRETFDNLSWLELYFWEFAWSAGEGVFLTTEHRVSYDITVPFNNRKYVEKMLTVPLKKRVVDDIPADLIRYMNPQIAETGIVIKDVSHTNFRSFVVRCYLEIMSKIRF